MVSCSIYHFGINYQIQWKWKSLSHVWLFATPWTVRTVHGILQARMLERVAFPFSRGSSQPRDRTQVSHIAGRFFSTQVNKTIQWQVFLRKLFKLIFSFCVIIIERMELNFILINYLYTICVYTCCDAQSSSTLCNLTDCRPPGFFIHGILQARILEWVAILFSRGSSRARNQT